MPWVSKNSNTFETLKLIQRLVSTNRLDVAQRSLLRNDIATRRKLLFIHWSRELPCIPLNVVPVHLVINQIRSALRLQMIEYCMACTILIPVRYRSNRLKGCKKVFGEYPLKEFIFDDKTY